MVQKIESKQINTSNLNDQLTKKDFSTIDKAVKPEVVSQANKDTVHIQTDGKKNKDNDQSDKDLNLKTQVKTADKETTVKKSEIQSRLSPDVNKKLDDTGSTGDEKISSNENVKSLIVNGFDRLNGTNNTLNFIMTLQVHTHF